MAAPWVRARESAAPEVAPLGAPLINEFRALRILYRPRLHHLYDGREHLQPLYGIPVEMRLGVFNVFWSEW